MRMKTGDLLPSLVVNLTDNGSPVNLTGASSVSVIGTQGSEVVFTDTSPDVDEAGGVVTHTWVDGETDVPGRVWIEVLVTWPTGEQTFPPYGQLAVDLED